MGRVGRRIAVNRNLVQYRITPKVSGRGGTLSGCDGRAEAGSKGYSAELANLLGLGRRRAVDLSTPSRQRGWLTTRGGSRDD